LHHWLLFPTYVDALSSNRDGDGLVLSKDPLINSLEQLELPLDSHVTVARPGPDRFLLQDVYRLVKGQPLTITLARDWSPGQEWSLGPRRDNYGGVQIRTVVIVSIILMMMMRRRRRRRRRRRTIIIIIIIILIIQFLFTSI
jgi:hypothetical protein